MKAIHDAYAVLSNPVQRAEYDRWLLERETEQVGKGYAVGMDEPKTSSSRWLLYTVAGIALLIAMGWLGFSGESDEDPGVEAPRKDGSVTQEGISSEMAVTRHAEETPGSGSATGLPMVVANDVPEHDKVALDAFFGTWKGTNGGSGGQQTLDISPKTDHSFIFRLDAKAGQGIGGVYGIAEFDNSFGHFFNKEYDCSILFTVKSGVLQLNTTSCQEYHETGVSFDGDYMKPETVNANAKAQTAKPRPAKTRPVSSSANQTQQMEPAPVAPVNVPKLRKFSATVKDSDGNVNTFELIAKDKAAARAIIRDFRGDPKVMKLKELKN